MAKPSRDSEMTRSDRGPSSSADSDGAETRLGDRLMELLSLQVQFRQRMETALNVDSAGLTTMIHLAGVGTDSPTAIAGALGASTAATSLVLNRLEAAGHIRRQPHPTDRRKVVVVPEPNSIARAYERANPVIVGTNELIVGLSDAERSTVTSFLERLITVYDDALRHPTDQPQREES